MPKNNFKNNPPKKQKQLPKTVDLQKSMLVRMQQKKHKELTNKERQDIIEAHNSLVQAIVANIVSAGKVPPNLHFTDLVSIGIEGVIKAWENFDAGRGIQFHVYASYRIRGEILDKIRKEWKYQNPGNYKSVYGRTEKKVAQAAVDSKNSGDKEASDEESVRDVVANSAMAYLLSYDEITEESVYNDDVDPGEKVVNQLEFSRQRTLLWQAVRGLTDDEKQVIKGFYIEDKTQNDIAQELGYSKSKISRMHAAVLKKLKQSLVKGGIEK